MISQILKNYHFCTTSKSNGLNVLFFGSDYFPLKTLTSLYNEMQKTKQNAPLIQNLEVVTHLNTKKQQKNTNPIDLFCQENRITVHSPIGKVGDIQIKDQWKIFSEQQIFKNEPKFNLGVICSYGYLIPSYLIDKFEHGIIVIHPSLLPQYRGSSPIYYSLLNGDSRTGVTFIEISKKIFDAGNILFQQKYEIPSHYNYKQLHDDLSSIASEKILYVIQNLHDLRQNSVKQDETQLSKAPKFEIADTYLNFAEESATKIINKVRAFGGSNFSAAKTKCKDDLIFIEQLISPSDAELIYLLEFENAQPGSVWILKKKQFQKFVYIKCKIGWIKLLEWRPFDQRKREAYKFIHKYLNNIEFDKKSGGNFFLQTV